jgi:sugar-specific transcriptional regulator TrmB
MKIHHKNLEYIGLTEKEARVYTSLLSVEKMQASNLARRTAIKQPTIYVILESLCRKHLVHQVQVGKRMYFVAESPEALRTIVENEHSEINKKIKQTEHIIASLKTIDMEEGQRPIVRFYEGKEALKKSIDEYVSTKNYSEEMDYGIYSYDLLPKIFNGKQLAEIESKRIQNNTRFRAIYSGVGKVLEGTTKLQELIKIDQERFPIECDIGIFNDEVRFHTAVKEGSSPSGILIKNKEIATTLKSMIEYIFSQKNQ